MAKSSQNKRFIDKLFRNIDESVVRFVFVKFLLKKFNLIPIWPISLAKLKSKNVLVEHLKIHSSEFVSFKSIVQFDSSLPADFVVYPQSVFELRNGFISTLDGIGFVPSFENHRMLVPIEKTAPIHPLAIANSIRPKLKRNYVRLSGNWICLPSRSLSHWLFEDLPRFINTLEFLQSNKIPFGIVASPYSISYSQEVINSLADINVEYQSFCSVEKFWFMNASGLETLPRKSDIKVIQDFFSRLFPPSEFSQTQKIYVSRKMSSRSLINEEEVEDFFRNLNFKIVSLEGLSWANVLDTFRSASVIVGPHGAGLSHFIFSKPETLVVELYDERMKYNSFFLSLSETAEQPFARIQYHSVEKLAVDLSTILKNYPNI